MNKNELILELNKVNGLRENRMRVAQIVIADIALIPLLIKIVFDLEKIVSVRASWILEFIVKENWKLLLPYLETFSKEVKNVTDSVRSMAKIIQLIVEQHNKSTFLSEIQKERFIETSFDWIISKHKVAIKAYTMRTLFLLGKENEWVHGELKIIIQENMHLESSAYKARGRITLKQIKQFNKL